MRSNSFGILYFASTSRACVGARRRGCHSAVAQRPSQAAMSFAAQAVRKAAPALSRGLKTSAAKCGVRSARALAAAAAAAALAGRAMPLPCANPKGARGGQRRRRRAAHTAAVAPRPWRAPADHLVRCIWARRCARPAVAWRASNMPSVAAGALAPSRKEGNPCGAHKKKRHHCHALRERHAPCASRTARRDRAGGQTLHPWRRRLCCAVLTVRLARLRTGSPGLQVRLPARYASRSLADARGAARGPACGRYAAAEFVGRECALQSPLCIALHVIS